MNTFLPTKNGGVFKSFVLILLNRVRSRKTMTLILLLSIAGKGVGHVLAVNWNPIAV